MRALPSIPCFLVIAFLLGVRPADAQIIGPPNPPTAKPGTSVFVGEVEVTLELPALVLGRILYDFNNGTPFDPSTAQEYEKPLKITETSTLRAVTESLGTYSEVAQWTYTKDRAPTVNLTYPANGQFFRRTTAYNLLSSASDPDGDALTVTYQYQAGANGAWTDIGSSSTATGGYAVSWTPAVESAHKVRAIARDPHSMTGTSNEVSITVTAPNIGPMFTNITPAEGASFPVGQAIPVSATVHDQDQTTGGGITKVVFLWDNVPFATDTQAPYTATYTGATVGAHEIHAVAYDNHPTPEPGSSSNVNITVRALNKKPTVTLSPSAPGPFPEPATFRLDAVASDSDGNVAAVLFFRGTTLLARDSSQPFQHTVSGLAAGTYSFTARAVDNHTPVPDTGFSAAVGITVNANQAPTVSAGKDTSLNPPSTTLQLRGQATDPEGTALTWRWTGSAGITFNPSDQQNSTASFPVAGPHTVTLTVTDGGNPAKSNSHTINVNVNAKPAVTSKLTDTGTVGANYAYTMTATGIPAPSFLVTGLPPGVARVGSSANFSGTPTAGGNYSVVITASNAAGSDQKTLALHIKEPPRFTQEPQENIPLLEKDPLRITVSAVGTPVPTYQWQLQQGTTWTNVGTTANTFIIDTVSLSNAGTYRVIARNGLNPPDTSRNCKVTVNALIRIVTPPVAPPQAIVVGRKHVFQVQATGAPTLLYQWFRGATSLGAPNAGAASLTLDPVKLNDAGQYRVRVTNSMTDTTKPKTFQITDAVQLNVILPKIDKPKAKPAPPAEYGDTPQIVELHTDTPSTVIRYTINGAEPTANTGMVYAPATKITLTQLTATIRAKAYRDNFTESDVFTGTYTYVEPSRAAKPVAKPIKPNFTIAWTCSLTTSTPGGQIKYTLDKSDPRTTAGILYEASKPLSISNTTTLTAYSYAPDYKDSDTMRVVFTYVPPTSKAPAPDIAPAGRPFTDSIQVSITHKLDSAQVKYTTDGTAPDVSGTAKTLLRDTLLTLKQTTSLRAVTVRPNWINSDIIQHTYTRVPGPIEASPAPIGGSYTFDDSVTVKLSVTPSNAKIYYTLNDSLPLDALGRPTAYSVAYTEGGFTLLSSYTVTAMAIDDTVMSKAYPFSYTKKGGALNTPRVTTSNGTHSFKDTLRVSLASIDGASIYYTRNSGDPSRSSELYRGPFTVDSTTIVQAMATHPAFEDSKILVSTFTLVADTPKAIPRGGVYFTPVNVTFTATSRKTPIIYTDDGTVPGADNGKPYTGEPIRVTKHTQLKAVALSGGVPGPLLEEDYRIFVARDTILPAGGTWFLEGGYTLTNPADQGIAVHVRQGPADSLTLPGFPAVSFSLTLTPHSEAGPGAEFPELILSRSTTELRGLYQYKDGKIIFVSGAEQAPIAEPGVYFTGLDTKPPTITYLEDETIDDSGYTVARFKVEDNVHNLVYSSRRNDNPLLNESLQPVFSGSTLTFKLKHAPGVLKALNLQLIVTDWMNYSYCPKDGVSFLALSQRLLNFQGPSIWRIGRNAETPHDLVGIPLNLVPALKLEDLADSKNGQVEAYIWKDNGTLPGTWTKLARKDPLIPGQAYWLGSHNPLTSLKRNAGRTAATGTGRFKVSLKHGWNQVANPHLETLYWPFSRSLGETYNEFRIKGLWIYEPQSPQTFVKSDSLEPWKGYYVYNHLQDTTVELSPKPALKPVLKKETGALAALELGFGDAPAIRLGASPTGIDAVGWDDEGLLPSLSARHRLKAVREGRGLGTDWIRLQSGKILQWRVLPVANPGAAEIPRLTMLSQDLPEGYEAWVLSRLRGMKFKLGADAALPTSGLPEDTLLVVAGPAAKLANSSLLDGLSEEAPGLDLRILRRGFGTEIRLDLPDRAQIRGTLWSLRGTSLGSLRRTLPGGRWHFSLPGDLSGAPSRPAPGVYILRLEVRGREGLSTFTRKVVFKD